jgi:hypothetical protein
MIDKLLITQSDIKVYRPTAELDDDRIVPFIIEAQNCDLKPVLNDALYYDFIQNFDLNDASATYTKYNELLYGKAYTYNAQTVYFSGVRPMLCYYALARFVASNPVHITRFGVVSKTGNQSSPVDPAALRGMINELRDAAISYQNALIQFLETLTTTYTLYDTGGGSDNAARRTSFNFFKL